MKSLRDIEREKLNKVSEKIIECAYKIHNTLGCGFLEKVYENSLIIELRKAGLNANQQEPIKVLYENTVVGNYLADILVAEEVIVELKAKKIIDDIDKAQLLNYLNATKLRLGIILNFGMPKLQIKRLVKGF